jgi:tryptophan synthase beta subunit
MDHLMVMNMCGRGDTDIFNVAEVLGGMCGGGAAATGWRDFEKAT